MAAEAARYPAVFPPRDYEAEKRAGDAGKAKLFGLGDRQRQACFCPMSGRDAARTDKRLVPRAQPIRSTKNPEAVQVAGRPDQQLQERLVRQRYSSVCCLAAAAPSDEAKVGIVRGAGPRGFSSRETFEGCG